jgi:hypothetical protein
LGVGAGIEQFKQVHGLIRLQASAACLAAVLSP